MSSDPVLIATAPAVWRVADTKLELRQGELITNLTLYDYNSESSEVDVKDLPIALVFCQDCDLLQDFNSRIEGKGGNIAHVLLFKGASIHDAKEQMGLGRDLFKALQNNERPRFHYLQSCPGSCDATGEGMLAMVVDFRSAVGMSADELYRQCRGTASRRAYLETPYKEHLQTRAAQFLSRIGLPVPHEVTKFGP